MAICGSAGDDLISVAVTTTGALKLGERRKLVDLSGYDAGQFHEFDVSPDGQRFLLIRTEPSSRPLRLDVIVNWLDELKAKTAARGRGTTGRPARAAGRSTIEQPQRVAAFSKTPMRPRMSAASL